MNGTLHHIEVNVADLEKTVAFWKWLLTEKFDYSIFQSWESGISFKYGHTYLVFVQTEGRFLQNPFHRKNAGLNHIAFHCNSQGFVDALTRELEQKNMSILYRDKHPYAGGKEHYAVFFEDPDRIKVEVVFSGE